jgi:hypothetical protein
MKGVVPFTRQVVFSFIIHHSSFIIFRGAAYEEKHTSTNLRFDGRVRESDGRRRGGAARL